MHQILVKETFHNSMYSPRCPLDKGTQLLLTMM